MGEAIQSFFEMTGFSMIANDPKVLIMIVISLVLMYLAIVKKFEPLLLLPIAFGMLLTNLPGAEMYHRELFASGHVDWAKLSDQGGLIDYLYLGIKLGIYPCLIFLGVGAMTDFGPLIANPKSLLLGAAAQGLLHDLVQPDLQIRVLHGQGLLPLEKLQRLQILRQTQQTVVSLIQHGGGFVQLHTAVDTIGHETTSFNGSGCSQCGLKRQL